MYSEIKNKTKLVMPFQMLRILGHEIVKSDWTVEKKKIFWGASCLAYFGSFRMGEILSKTKGGEPENLKWGDVNFRPDGSALLNIRFPKIIKNVQGDFVDIFGLEGKDYCPVQCLKSLAKNAAHENNKNKNVFSFSDGTCLTINFYRVKLCIKTCDIMMALLYCVATCNSSTFCRYKIIMVVITFVLCA